MVRYLADLATLPFWLNTYKAPLFFFVFNISVYQCLLLALGAVCPGEDLWLINSFSFFSEIPAFLSGRNLFVF
tara:strand:- start:275 stop:493 length:219 start_codon:yes stop_codon:yes gene_type:complete